MNSRHRYGLVAVAAGLLLAGPWALAQQDEAPAQDTRDIQDTWNLDELFPSVADWEAAKPGLESRTEEVAACKGKLGESEQLCREMLSLYPDQRMFQDRLNTIAAIRKANAPPPKKNAPPPPAKKPPPPPKK